jgi:CheY-like chemotaxis protein
MPIMDGITAAAEIRRLEGEGNLARMAIIAITGNARQEYIERGRKPLNLLLTFSFLCRDRLFHG